MAILDTNSQLINGDGGIVVEGSSVGGGYFVTSSVEITSSGEKGKIPNYACILGALCYCSTDKKFYQYLTVTEEIEGETITTNKWVNVRLDEVAVRLDNEIAAREKAIADEQTARKAVDTNLLMKINNETVRVNEELATVGEMLNKETTKLDILIGNDGDKSARTIANEELAAQLIPESAQEALDTLNEIASWIQQHPEDAASMNAAIQQLQENLCKEIKRAKDAEQTLNTKIDTEVTLREAQINGLNFSLKEEINYAREAEKLLDDRITTESSRAVEAEKELSEKLTAEESRAKNAETSLDKKIDEEIELRTAQINGINFSTKEEVNRAQAAEKELLNKIEAESTRASKKEDEIITSLQKESNRAIAEEQNIRDSFNNYENVIGFVQAGEKTLVETFNEALEAEVDRAKEAEQKLNKTIEEEGTRITEDLTSIREEANKEAQKVSTLIGGQQDEEKSVRTIAKELTDAEQKRAKEVENTIINENIKQQKEIDFLYDRPTEGLDYEINWGEQTAKCTGFKEGIPIPDRVIIPEEISYEGEKYSVTEIAFGAFSEKSFSSVHLPDTLIKIGTTAFEKCTNLFEINIPDSVEEIGDAAFSESGIIEIKIGEGIEDFNDSVFYNCTKLKKVRVGNNFKQLGTATFYNCTSLVDIEFPNSLEGIGDHAFYNCISLKSLSLPNSLATVGYAAFFGCTNLKHLFINNQGTNLTNSFLESEEKTTHFIEIYVPWNAPQKEEDQIDPLDWGLENALVHYKQENAYFTNTVPSMYQIDAARLIEKGNPDEYYFSPNNWAKFKAENRVYIENGRGRGAYGMYALTYGSSPIYNPWYSKEEWKRNYKNKYGTDPNRGPYDTEYPLLNSVAQRLTSGDIAVPSIPGDPNYATSKQYVDNKIVSQLDAYGLENPSKATEGQFLVIKNGKIAYVTLANAEDTPV